MLAVDPPDHTRLRRIALPAFSKRRVLGLEDRVRAIVTRLLDGLAARGDGPACFQLAEWRREGRFVPRDLGAARELYCRAGEGEAIVRVAKETGLDAMLGGRVEEGPRRVVLEPLGISFDGSELELAPS
jgi:hypothetical protein